MKTHISVFSGKPIITSGKKWWGFDLNNRRISLTFILKTGGRRP